MTDPVFGDAEDARRVWVALLRGINVGGRNRLPMAELRAILERAGAVHVETYIQSGNVVFRHAAADPADLGDRIGESIEAAHGFRPQVLVLGSAEFEAALVANPFPEATDDPKALHAFFLTRTPRSPDLPSLEALAANGERFELVGRVFWLHAPGGIGRSKLAAAVERALGVPVTARNWRSASQIRELAAEVEAR